MSESVLKKEFQQRDIQRLRNLVQGKHGDKTVVGIGYTKQQEFHNEGDIWEEDGRKWTIKNGIKQTVTKFDKLKQLVVFPLVCPECSKPMKSNDLNKKMFNIHNKCFDCVIEMEAKIKKDGKWDEYEKGMMNANKNAMVDDFEKAFTDYITSKNESYFTEAGDMESWSGGKINEDEIKNVKEYIKKLREHEL
jgi:hypothetical protein